MTSVSPNWTRGVDGEAVFEPDFEAEAGQAKGVAPHDALPLPPESASWRQRLRPQLPRDSIYRRCVAFADGVAATGATALAIAFGRAPHNLALLALAPAIVLISKLFGIYDREDLLIRKSSLDEAPALFQVATSFALASWLIDGVLITGRNDRRSLLVLWIALFLLLLGLRAAARFVASRLSHADRCLVLSDESTFAWLHQAFGRRRALHATVVGWVDSEHFNQSPHSNRGPVTPSVVRDLAAQLRANRIVIGSGLAAAEEMMGVIRTATSHGLKVSVMPKVLEAVGSAARFDEIDGMPLLSIYCPRLSHSSRISKRVLDVVCSGTAVIVLAPLFALIACAIKLTSRGPVLFTQLRVGHNGKPFRMFKFRTMECNAEQRKKEFLHLNEAHGLFKIAKDPRITPVGRLLRRASLDELPQLFNVIRGEMSLVGPRPLVAEEDQYIEGWHRRRLQLTPGMTGHWQILGSSRIPLEEMVRIDYLYVTNWSLWVDVKILLRTIPYVLYGKGM